MDSYFVSEKEAGQRLDCYLSNRFPSHSRSYFQNLIHRGLVLLNGKQVKKRIEVGENDAIEVEFALTPEIAITPEPIPLDLLYEDDSILVVNKPPGMVVHPAVGHWTGTFVNALLYHCKLEGEGLRPGIVHRLDKDTSGVMVAAKNSAVQQKLVTLFTSRAVEKEYVAITIGNPGNRIIEGNIGRHPMKRQQMALLEEGGKAAKTVVTSSSHNAQLAVVYLFPETGRTHQLRVHLQSVGSPILGDSLYGNMQCNQKFGAERQLLHAHRLTLSHPVTDDRMSFTAPIPQDIQSFIDTIAEF